MQQHPSRKNGAATMRSSLALALALAVSVLAATATPGAAVAFRYTAAVAAGKLDRTAKITRRKRTDPEASHLAALDALDRERRLNDRCDGSGCGTVLTSFLGAKFCTGGCDTACTWIKTKCDSGCDNTCTGTSAL